MFSRLTGLLPYFRRPSTRAQAPSPRGSAHPVGPRRDPNVPEFILEAARNLERSLGGGSQVLGWSGTESNLSQVVSLLACRSEVHPDTMMGNGEHVLRYNERTTITLTQGQSGVLIAHLKTRPIEVTPRDNPS